MVRFLQKREEEMLDNIRRLGWEEGKEATRRHRHLCSQVNAEKQGKQATSHKHGPSHESNNKSMRKTKDDNQVPFFSLDLTVSC